MRRALTRQRSPSRQRGTRSSTARSDCQSRDYHPASSSQPANAVSKALYLIEDVLIAG